MYTLQVVKVDLEHNDLTTIPKCLLELPSLVLLNLAHNKLQELPEVPEWSPCLTVLDLSDNQLSSLPSQVVAPAIRSLNIANNNFHTVPLCICSFTTLHSLNLSGNSNIVALPKEMGRLSYLSHLNLSGLKNLREPPKRLQKECRDCIRYLNSKLRNARGFYRMKLMVVGYANRGKTTLVARLQGKEYGDESTVGVDVSEWWYRPSVGRRVFHFSIWDFAGQEEYYATHQCFISQRSLYLLLFNLTHGDRGVEELKPWLNNIALRAPRSCVIIIGTHLDEILDEDRGEIDALLHRVGTLAASYNNRLQIVEVLPVGLKYRIENIGLLKDSIYNHAANYKTRGGQLIMGQKIPASYHALDKQLETVQQEVRQGIREPIMHNEEFKAMVHLMNLADIEDDEELKTATLFLTDVGSLLHFDDRGHNLHELYFVDPRWLCDMMSKVVTIKERNPFVKCGILYSRDIPMLFKDKQFPWQYFEQYLALLDKFEIALPLDNRRVLVPSMLPDERPKEFEDEKPHTQEHVYSRIIMFSSANTPPGFWSRLLSRIMHSVPKVCYALDKSRSTSEPSPSRITPSNPNAEAEMSFSMHPMTPTETSRAFGEISVNTETCLNMSTKSSSSFQILAGTPGSATPFIAAPTISSPLPIVSTQQPFINAPQLLQNFTKSLPNDISESFDTKDIHLEYWRTGLYYKDPEIMFRIESLTGTKQFKRELKDGVHVIASANYYGKKIISQFVDLVVSLVGEWYPGLQEGKYGSYGLVQKVPCFECIKQGRTRPYEFKVEQCLPMIAMNETTMECGYFCDNPAKNHKVSLGDIVPDLLFQDIDPEFLLDAKEINYQEDDSSLLGKGGYGKVYRGKCKGKSVAIKKYLSRSEEAFTELRSEATLLQQSHHPCIVCLIGVCIHPLMALILEEAPLKSLEFPIIKKKIPVHRLTIFRIAAEVAAALRFLHSRGIICRGVKAADVLLWTLDPDSLCHCKLADFGCATHLAPVGTRGLQGTKGFIAPEVLHIGKRKQRSTYDHRADIFSFAMFLYQLIARRHPYHNIPPHRIDATVEQGERPKLQDVDICRTGYHYLTQVMKACWEDNPKNRLDTDTIIKKVCQSATQMVMCVAPISGKQSLRRAVTITPSIFSKAGHPNRLQNELWVCCDGAKGAEVSMFNTHCMMEVNHVFIRDNQVQCMALCGDHVWVASRTGIEYGVINIISISSREFVHNFRMPHENSVACITATDNAVYLGTLEGYCFSFYNDISAVCANIKPRYKYISEYAVDGIACTQQCVWAAHTRYIYFLNFDNLALEGSIHHEREQEVFIGQLSFDPDHNTVWSAHLGGVILSAWDAYNKCHMYDIDTSRNLKRIIGIIDDTDNIITAMTPALDTVWVGMASGHIMVFYEEELLSWFHPYKGYVRFLTCIPSGGPCEMEKTMVASGGKQFRPLAEGLDKDDSGLSNSSESGTLIIWEAYEARTMKQLKLIEQNAPNHLDNHTTIRRVIKEGGFRDGTHIMLDSDEANIPTGTETLPFEPSLNFEDSFNIQTPSSEEEMFDIKLPDSKQTIQIRCTKPVTLKSLNNELGKATVAQDDDYLVYYIDEEAYELQTQENLDEYLRMPDKPQLCIVSIETHAPKIHHATDKSSEEEISIRMMDPVEQNLKLTCPKPAQLDALMNEMATLGSLKDQKFNLTYLSNNVEIKVTAQEDFDKYLALSNRSPLLVKVEQEYSPITEDSEITYAVSSSSNTQSLEHTDDVTLHFKLFDSENTLDVSCTKPLRLEAVLDNLRLIANLGDHDWQLVYLVDESYIKIETQEDFEKYLNSTSKPMLSIIS